MGRKPEAIETGMADGVYFGLTEGVEKALVTDLVPRDRRGAAFGWYNLAIGIGALPASLLFGALWDRWGSATAFDFGALLALLAAVGVICVVPRRAALAARGWARLSSAHVRLSGG